MVHWGPITPEQKDIYRHRLDYVPDIALTFIGNALNETGFISSNPTEAKIEEIDEKFRAIVDENLPMYKEMRDLKLYPISLFFGGCGISQFIKNVKFKTGH